MSEEKRDPELSDLLRGAMRARLLDVHTAIPGQIKSYDASKGQVDVQPLIQQRRRGEDGTITAKDYPLVRGCMVMFPRCASGYITFPLAVNDLGLIIFCEKDVGDWAYKQAGQSVDPGDGDTHSLMGGVFYPGLYPTTSPITPTPSEQHVVVQASNQLHLGEGNLTAADLVAIGALVDARLSTIQSTFDLHMHPSGMGPTGVPTSLIVSLASVKATKVMAK